LGKLPYTTYGFDTLNDIYKQIIPFVEIEAATSLVFFSKEGMIQELMHQLKYKGHQEIGDLFGELLAEKIKNNDQNKKIDLVVPIPLHPKKLKKRGYNQLTRFGKKIAEMLGAEYEEKLLYKNKHNESQTKKNALERKENVAGIFSLNEAAKYSGKHILLIDDVITTGATLVEAARELKKIPGVKVSIATMAIADQL
jgi:ComF family protein